MVSSTFRKSWLYVQRAESPSAFVLFKVRPSLSVQTSVATYRATWLHVTEERLVSLHSCEKIKPRVTVLIE